MYAAAILIKAPVYIPFFSCLLILVYVSLLFDGRASHIRYRIKKNPVKTRPFIRPFIKSKYVPSFSKVAG